MNNIEILCKLIEFNEIRNDIFSTSITVINCLHCHLISLFFWNLFFLDILNRISIVGSSLFYDFK